MLENAFLHRRTAGGANAVLIASILAVAIAAPARFDLSCVGQFIYVGSPAMPPDPYQNRFSIDLTSALYSDNYHVKPSRIAKIDDQTVWIEQDSGKGNTGSFLSIDRFSMTLTGIVRYPTGFKIERRAKCKLEPFTRWDHRAF